MGGGGAHILLRVHTKFKLIYFGPENSENLFNTSSVKRLLPPQEL